MPEILPYIRTVFVLAALRSPVLSEGYVRREHMEGEIRSGLLNALQPYEVELPEETELLVTSLFDEMLQAGALESLTDRFAGTYFRAVKSKVAEFREAALTQNPVFDLHKRIRPSFFGDVFTAYERAKDGSEPFGGALHAVSVPASDRVVTLSHNQIDEIDRPLSELVESLEADNGIPDMPGLKERLLGQVKAGRELIRAGSFKSYLLYLTLIGGLGELIARYKDHVIGAAAGKLVELLIQHIFERTA